MPEVWIRTNIRPFLPAAALCALIVSMGAAVAAGAPGDALPVWLRWVGGVIACAALVGLCGLGWLMRRPRLSRDDDHLLVQLQHARRERVPLAAVECFLLGSGPAYLSRYREKDGQVSTIVVRLSPKAEELARRDVDPRLGAWCDGHITLRGTWCEPIDLDLVKRLNKRLGEVQRQFSAASHNKVNAE